MIGTHPLKLRSLTSANGLRAGAPATEDTRGGRVDGARNVPRQVRPLPWTSWLRDGNGGEERLGVGVIGVVVQGTGGGDLHDLPYPGIGRLLFAGINQRDIPLVQAGVILLAGIFILLNLVVDLVYVRLDPRMKLAEGRG